MAVRAWVSSGAWRSAANGARMQSSRRPNCAKAMARSVYEVGVVASAALDGRQTLWGQRSGGVDGCARFADRVLGGDAVQVPRWPG